MRSDLSQPSRRTRTSGGALLFAAALLLAACGGDTDGLSAPVPVRVAQVAGAGGLAASEAAPMVSDARMGWWFAGFTYEAAPELGPLPTASTGYRFAPEPDITEEQVRTVAVALGLTDDPVRAEGTEAYDPLWTLGPLDGSAPSMTVVRDAQGSWYYSAAWDRGGAVSVEVAPSQGAGESDAAADSGSATTTDTPTDQDRPVPVEEWEPPVPPEGVPTAAEARARVDAIMAAMGEDLTTFEVEVWADEWTASVILWPVRDGVRSALSWNFGFGGGGELQWASGFLATAEAVGPYPLIDLVTAIARLEEQFAGWGPEIGIGYPAPDANGVEPTEEMPEEMLQKETALLTAVRADLWWATDADGSVWLLPAYRFIDSEDREHIVPAVSDEYLVIEPAVELVEPLPAVEPAVGDTPVVGGPEMDEESMEKLLEWATTSLVGLGLAEATAAAEANGAVVRVARSNGEEMMLTRDYVMNRINLAVEGAAGAETVVEVMFVG